MEEDIFVLSNCKTFILSYFIVDEAPENCEDFVNNNGLGLFKTFINVSSILFFSYFMMKTQHLTTHDFQCKLHLTEMSLKLSLDLQQSLFMMWCD